MSRAYQTELCGIGRMNVGGGNDSVTLGLDDVIGVMYTTRLCSQKQICHLEASPY